MADHLLTRLSNNKMLAQHELHSPSKNNNSNHHTYISCFCYFGFLYFGLPLTDILDYTSHSICESVGRWAVSPQGDQVNLGALVLD